MVGDPQTSPVISQAKRQSTSVVDDMREEEHKDGEGKRNKKQLFKAVRKMRMSDWLIQ